MINDDISADKALEERKQLILEKSKWAQFYEEQNRKAQEKLDFEITGIDYSLNDYFIRLENVRETKTQLSYSLPGGKLKLVKPTVEYIHDDDVLMPWAEENGFVKEKRTVAWADIKEHIKQTGELPDGVTVQEKPEHFEVS
jgi:hypothetical protein